MRLAGSYSSMLSKRFQKLRCSAPCDNRYFCNSTDPENGEKKVSFFLGGVLSLRRLDSPVTAYTWLSRSVRPWSSRSSPGAPGGSISAVWEVRSCFISFFTLVRVRTSILPAPLNHSARNRPLYPLHHSQVLLVVVRLQKENK